MKAWMWKGLGAGVLALLLAGNTVAYPRGCPKGRGLLLPQLAEELRLSEEQRDQLQQLRRDKEKKTIELEAQIRLRHLELAELIDAAAPHRGAIRAKIDELAGLAAERRMLEIETRLEAKSLLTPEQRDQLEQRRGRLVHERSAERLRRSRPGPPAGPEDPEDRF